jgi:hypothetical protein
MKTALLQRLQVLYGDVINYTPATTALSSNAETILPQTLGANPNYTVVSTDGTFNGNAKKVLS